MNSGDFLLDLVEVVEERLVEILGRDVVTLHELRLALPKFHSLSFAFLLREKSKVLPPHLAHRLIKDLGGIH